MAHAIILTRGIKHDVDRAITELQGKKLPMQFHGKDSLIDLAVRPIQLWDFVFPAPQMQVMMRSLFISPMNPEGLINWNPKHNKYLTMIRAAMGLKKFPELEKTGARIPFYNENIEFMGIGIKDDNFEQL